MRTGSDPSEINRFQNHTGKGHLDFLYLLTCTIETHKCKCNLSDKRTNVGSKAFAKLIIDFYLIQ